MENNVHKMTNNLDNVENLRNKSENMTFQSQIFIDGKKIISIIII
jgi:hypothetical protein